VDANAHQKVHAELPCGTKQLGDRSSIADVNVWLGILQKRRGLPRIFQPADALFLSNGCRGRDGLSSLEYCSHQKLSRVRNLHAIKSSGRSCRLTAKLKCIEIPHSVEMQTTSIGPACDEIAKRADGRPHPRDGK
jgi:hypothetical protein